MFCQNIGNITLKTKNFILISGFCCKSFVTLYLYFKEKYYKMENLLKIPYTVFNNDWDLLQQFLNRRGNPRYELVGDVELYNQQNIFDLGNLVRVDGDLLLHFTPIQSLGNLEYVNGDFHITNIQISTLGNLRYVAGSLFLDTKIIQSLGNLEYVGGNIWLKRNHQIPPEQLNNFKIKYY